MSFRNTDNIVADIILSASFIFCSVEFILE
jgi:hypothetical protein